MITLAPRTPAPAPKPKSEVELLRDKINNGGYPAGTDPNTGKPTGKGTLYRLGNNLGDTPAVEAFRLAREKEKKLKEDERRPRGRLATILTSPGGLLDEPTTSRRQLLGY